MPAAKSYHHGNLKSALLDASFVLIEEQGIEQLSFRQLAGKTGVSHTAAYRHFRGKDQLLATLAATTLKRIADRIRYHSLKGYTPGEKLQRGALAALRYGLDHPAEMRLLGKLEGRPLSDSPAVAALAELSDATRATLLWLQLTGLAEQVSRQSLSRKEATQLAEAGIKSFYS